MGYGGSGPAQAAFGILLCASRDVTFARRLYQLFKWVHVSAFPQGKDFEVEIDLFDWLDAKPTRAIWQDDKYLVEVVNRMKDEKGVCR